MIAKGLIERYHFSAFNDVAYRENPTWIHSISLPHVIMQYACELEASIDKIKIQDLININQV